jgi:predicted MFS family arabinose efflux permease
MTQARAAAEPAPSGAGEFRRGWRIVLASVVGICFGLSPMPIYTMGAFAPHLASAFGWSIGEIMAGITVTTAAMLLASPMVAWLTARHGVRRVVLVSQVLFGFSFMALGLSTGSLPLFYTNWALVTFTGAGTLPITWTQAVNRRFDTHKGLALGIAMMGSGLFGMLGKPMLGALLPVLGWRACYAVLGLLPLVIGFPTAWFLFRDTDTKAPAAPSEMANASGLSLPEVLRQWRFWLLTVIIVFISFALGGPVPNMETMLAQAGLSPATILALAPMIGFSALLGRVVGGWLLDRFWAPAVGCVILALPALSCHLLAMPDLAGGGAMAAMFLIGFGLGIEYDLMAYFVSRYFGMRSYGGAYALLYVAFSIGAGLGPVLMGWDFDRNGSYRLSLGVSSALLVASAMSLLLFGRYRRWAGAA